MCGDIDAEPVVFDKKRIAVTITVGMSRKQEGQSIDEWIQHIDDLLYAGKNSGKNRVVQEKDK
ncbi:MAG: diguanylate cyclase [Ruminococcus sp.]|nr:diguanylate cyclase [Ruminococcus sp.]